MHSKFFFSLNVYINACRVTDMNRATEIFLRFVYASSIVKIRFYLFENGCEDGKK